MAGTSGLVAGGVDGVGHPVVLAGLPDDRIPVVLPCVVDSDPDPQGEGGFPVTDGLAAIGPVLVGGDAELGVEPVEGLLALVYGIALELGVGVVEHVTQAGVVVAVAGVQVAAEAVGELLDGPVAELVAAEGGRGLQMGKQFLVAVADGTVLVGPVELWRLDSGWV
jgi:hypothetical protein